MKINNVVLMDTTRQGPYSEVSQQLLDEMCEKFEPGKIPVLDGPTGTIRIPNHIGAVEDLWNEDGVLYAQINLGDMSFDFEAEGKLMSVSLPQRKPKIEKSKAQAKKEKAKKRKKKKRKKR